MLCRFFLALCAAKTSSSRCLDTPDEADLVLLNTCHIREKATEKVFSELGQLKRLKAASGGNMLLGVTGCVAQAEGEEILKRAPYVDMVFRTYARPARSARGL